MWKFANPSVRMNIPAGHLHLPPRPLCLRHSSGLLTAHTHTGVPRASRSHPRPEINNRIPASGCSVGPTAPLRLFQDDKRFKSPSQQGLPVRKHFKNQHNHKKNRCFGAEGVNGTDLALCHVLEIVVRCHGFVFCKNHIIYGTIHFLQKAWHLEIRGRTTHNYMFPAAGKKFIFLYSN